MELQVLIQPLPLTRVQLRECIIKSGLPRIDGPAIAVLQEFATTGLEIGLFFGPVGGSSVHVW